MNFPAGIKNVLNNKFVVYLVYFIAAMNIFGYINLNDFNSIALFTLVAYVTSFLNKNNVVILLVAVLITNILGNTQFMIIEGLKGRKKKEGVENINDDDNDDDNNDDDDDDDDVDDDDDDLVTGIGDDVVGDDMGGRGIDKKASMEAQYENLDNILGKDGIEAMTKDTQKLIKRQGKLAESMQAMGPLLNNAQELLQGFDMKQLNGLQDTLKSLKQKK